MATGIDAGQGRSIADGNGWGLGVDASTSPTPAIRGYRQGRVGWTGGSDGEGLARVLGLFSVGLGVSQVLAPGGVARLAGIEPSTRTRVIMRAAGLREIGHGVGILTNPRSKEWVGTRIAGDILDLALLTSALIGGTRHPQRTIFATAAVLGVTALDVLCTEDLSQSRKAPSPEILDEPGTPVIKSLTIGLPVAEVYRFWRNFENLPRFMRHLESVHDMGGGRSYWRARGPGGVTAEWEAEITEEVENERIAWRSVGSPRVYNAGTVRFRPSRDGKETVVTVEMRYAPPGGKIGAAMLKLVRREPGQQVGDDLRRLKQVLETGEVVHSDATAVGRPHPAQPIGREHRA
jgi:uncharacterized membrane protein